MVFHPPHIVGISLDKEAILQLPILRITRVKRYLSISRIDLLNLSGYDVTLSEVVPNVELVLFIDSSLDPTGLVDRAEVEDTVLVRIDVNHPSLLVDLDDSTDDNVTNVWSVALSERPHANDSVYLVDHACHGRVD